MHAYISPSFSHRERKRLAKRLVQRLPVPNDPVIGRRAVAFLCVASLAGAAALAVAGALL